MNRVLLGLTASVLAIALTGCVTSGSSMSSSAERLERSSYVLERNSRDDGVRAGFHTDALALAEEARDFRRTLGDSRADNRDLRAAFSDLSRRYHALRDEVEHSNDRDVARDFAAVTDAYLDIERELEHGRKDRYARD